MKHVYRCQSNKAKNKKQNKQTKNTLVPSQDHCVNPIESAVRALSYFIHLGAVCMFREKVYALCSVYITWSFFFKFYIPTFIYKVPGISSNILTEYIHQTQMQKRTRPH